MHYGEIIGLSLIFGCSAVASGEEKILVTRGPSVRSVAFSPEGKTLASANRDGVKLWSTETWDEKQTYKIRAHRVEFSPDGKVLAVTGQDVKSPYAGFIEFVDAQAGKTMRALKVPGGGQ
jgi:WD40 repeat protein